jgi:hypothetical protein
VPNVPNDFDVFNAHYEPNLLDESVIFSVTNVLDVTDIIENITINNVIDITKVLDITDITDVINISDDLYDLSHETDPFIISSPVDTITHVSKVIPRSVINEKACENQDKWFYANDKTKDLKDKIDDKSKSVKLVYIKAPTSSPFPSRPPRKPPFSPQQSRDINLHEITTYGSLQVHTHELEPDPASDKIVTDDPPVNEAEHEPPEILLINAAKGNHPNLNHDFKEDEQWGEIPKMALSFDEDSEYEHCIIDQHLAYFQRQGGNLFDDIFDQAVPDALDTEPLQEIIFYDAHEPELGLPSGDSLPVLTPSEPKTLTKCAADDDNLRARMSGGETSFNIKKDISNIDMSKLADTSNAAGTGYGTPICGVEFNLDGMSDTAVTGTPIKGVDLELPHPPDGTLKDRPKSGVNTGMLNNGNKPPPPPEPPPTIFNIHQKLNKNGNLPKEIPIPKTRHIWDPGNINDISNFKDICHTKSIRYIRDTRF